MPEPQRGTILAFDFGIRRIGVAVGEPETGTAHPLPGIAVSGDARFVAIGAQQRVSRGGVVDRDNKCLSLWW